MRPLEFAHLKGLEYAGPKSKGHKKELGQYFTSDIVAKFMASLVDQQFSLWLILTEFDTFQRFVNGVVSCFCRVLF
jgi:hypothetical protein